MPLTEPIRRVLRLARGHAEAMGHDYAGTGDVFLGLLAAQDGVAGRVLRSLGFQSEELTERLGGPRGALEERATGASWLSRPAKMAVECGLQEALVLGDRHANTEHVLLGLLRTTHTYPDTAFVRIVGFEDRLRIRNETLRLVARAPIPAEVARRKAMNAAGPQSEFEADALEVLLDALKNIPAAEASVIQRMTLQLSFEQENRERPQLEVYWITADDLSGAAKLGSYAGRIPPSGPDRQHGAELRQKWVDEVSRSPQRVDGLISPEWEAEMESALFLLARRLWRLLHKSDLLWEVVGHGIPIIIKPASPHRNIETKSPA